jgi:hypothetical protein
MAIVTSENRWWVFDRPLSRDPIFVVGIALGIASVVSVVASRDDYGALALILQIVTALPLALLFAGILLGTPREYIRGRRRRLP